MLGTLLLVDSVMGLALGATLLTEPKPQPTDPVRRRAKSPGQQLAESVLRAWPGTLPVDVLALSAACQVPVRGMALESDVGALLDWSRDAERVSARMTVNTAMSAAAQRFAVAHALCRALQRHTSVTHVRRASFFTGVTSAEEKVANDFALHLLIPTYGFESMIGRLGKVEKLAKVYGVAPAAMGNRITSFFGY